MATAEAGKARFGNSRLTRWGSLIAVIAFIAFAIVLLPRGFSTDLGRIGQGSPVVVLVHDNGSSASLTVMDMLNAMRNEFDRLEFVVADVNTPQGRAFAEPHRFAAATVLFYDSGGRLVHSLHAPRAEESIRQALVTLH